ncbi:MAG: endolytic transglycosylase MltG [Clostridiales bacterium]|nr:endolytic transglycosylase MltG [Clostridiales bacterium]
MIKRIVSICVAALGLSLLFACSRQTAKEPAGGQTSDPTTVRVTVPEGYTAYEIAVLLEEKGVCPKDDFIAAINESGEQDYYPVIENPGERPFLYEGYIFPDTYDFYIGESAKSALGRFLKNMQNKLAVEDYERAAELGYSMDEIITIASLVQEEAGRPAQDAKVASVIYNRLNSKDFPRLQLNVTFEYLDKSVEPIFPQARENYDELYNTYKRQGLPAGPIANPGRACIEAALYPAESDYYFFLTDKDMNYYYSKTKAEHDSLWAIHRH